MNYQPHEYANLFPMMDGEAFEELKESIRKDGFNERHPIILYEEKILDGRNRYKACLELGIDPFFERVNGNTNPLDFVIRENKTRRHLTPDQLAMIALDVEAIESERAKKRMLAGVKNNPSQNPDQGSKGKAAEKAAKKVGASRGKVQRAKALKKKNPKLAEQVKNGEMDLPTAEKKARAEEAEQARKEMAETGKELSIPDGVQLFHGDFRELGNQIPDNSIDLIFTDPPYDKKSVPLYEDLAKFAARVLKPGGSLITYVGHYAVGKVYNLMENHLRYWWLLGVKHSGASAKLPGVNVIVEWKPLLWFVKETRHGGEFVRDMLVSDAPSKKEHEWQQGYTEADYYIKYLTSEGGIVLDPFAGSGTTLISALNLGRKSIGYEIDEERYYVAKQHISDKARL